MDRVLNVTFASSLTKLCEYNSSFDTGVLRICYTGENQNGSYISKETLMDSLNSIYNCPLVCNYDRETNTLGGHDMEVVRYDDGSLKLVNLTDPVGVIPESANVWFEDYEENDGTVHEYLYADVLLWKRQEAYQKIKDDGITSHSMEITVKDGEMIDGVYHINKFEFTAFALIGVTPCFESSELEMFSKSDFKRQLSEMMQDLKETFSSVDSSIQDDDIHSQDYTEGGEEVLDKKKELMAKYGIDESTLDFSLEDFTEEELEAKFKAMTAEEPEDVPESEDAPEDKAEDFGLLSVTIHSLKEAVRDVEKISDNYGEYSRYYYADCDLDEHEVYVEDSKDWNLYGFTYSIVGDRIVLDKSSLKRKKYAIVDYEDGEMEQPSPFAEVFSIMDEKLQAAAEFESKYQKASEMIDSMDAELKELREFKANIENAEAQSEREELFAQFENLTGNEMFEALRQDSMKYDLETLEEKCFSILGRMNAGKMNFSAKKNTPILKVDKNADDDDGEDSYKPYGDLFDKYSKN